MAGMGLPSMFDTKYEMDRELEKDAQNTGRLPLGGGMLYATSMVGDLDNRNLMNLSSMLGGTGDPRLEKQKAVDSVMKEFGKNPETIEDYKTIAQMFNSIGQYGFAEKAMDQVREIQKNATQTTFKTEKVGVMKNGKRYTETWKVDNAGNYIKLLGEQLTSEPSTSTQTPSKPKDDAYLSWSKANPNATAQDIQDWESGYARDLLKAPTKDDTNVILGRFIREQRLKIKTEQPEISDSDLDMLAAEQAQIQLDDYNVRLAQRENAGTYSPLQLQDMINPDTLAINPETELAGTLYNANLPNGRKYTSAESQVASKEYKRLNSDEVYVQMKDEENFKDVNKIMTANNLVADGARSELNDLGTMIELLENGAKTGFAQEFKDEFASLLESVGIENPRLASNQVLRTKMKSLALARLAFLKGAASDKDIDFVEAAGAQMNKSEEANMVVLKIAQILANETVDNNNHMNQWVQTFKDKNKGRSPNSSQYRTQLASYINREDKMSISDQIGSTMQDVLNLEPDLSFNAQQKEYAQNAALISAMKEKYSKN